MPSVPHNHGYRTVDPLKPGGGTIGGDVTLNHNHGYRTVDPLKHVVHGFSLSDIAHNHGYRTVDPLKPVGIATSPKSQSKTRQNNMRGLALRRRFTHLCLAG